MTPPDRPSITPDLVDRFAAYYRANPVWGSLHVVLEDGNLQHCSVDYCVEQAVEEGDVEGAALGRILRSMSRSQRARIAARASGIVWAEYRAGGRPWTSGVSA